MISSALSQTLFGSRYRYLHLQWPKTPGLGFLPRNANGEALGALSSYASFLGFPHNFAGMGCVAHFITAHYSRDTPTLQRSQRLFRITCSALTFPRNTNRNGTCQLLSNLRIRQPYRGSPGSPPLCRMDGAVACISLHGRAEKQAANHLLRYFGSCWRR